MFTGLVEEVGTVDAVTETGAGCEFRLRCTYADLHPGESIAVNGACLTIRECGPGWCVVAAVTTTLGRTAMASWRPGSRVNLERALRLGDRLGGHLVQGHVDGVGAVRDVRRDGSALLIDIAVDDEVAAVLVPHGSVAVDGVSMTVNALPASRLLQVSVIEYTAAHTTLGALRPGDRVHLEGDIIGKYVRSLVAPYSAEPPP